jgi:hypothetical protein
MDKGQKLLELMAGTNFRVHVDCSSPERFLESGKRIDAEYAKIEALGEDHQNRIWCLLRLVLAEQLQPQALSKYGNSSDSSLRRVLADELLQSEDTKWIEAARMAKEALRGQGLTDQQLEMIGQLFDSFPGVIIDFIVEGIRQMCLVPLSEEPEIAGILCEMLKEAEGYADNIRNN